MADVERSLISKIASDGDLADVVAQGIEVDHFADDDCAEIFEWMLDFQRMHKSTPSTRALKKEFAHFNPEISKDPLSYHIEQFMLKVKERTAIDLVRNYHDAIDDPELLPDIEMYALEMARSLTDIIPSPRAHRFSAMPLRVKEYDRRKAEDIQHGIFMGIPSFDKETLGTQPTDLVVWVAYFGVGKTTAMQYVAYMAYLHKHTSEIVSLEMEGEAILRKLDALAAKVKYHALKALELGVGDYEQWSRIAEQAHKDRHERDIIIRDDIKNCTVDKVMSDMMRYKPDQILVDYLELMHIPRSQRRGAWENVSENGIGLKEAARVMKIPVHTAAQLNREGGKGDVGLHNISYQSVGKHSDLLIGLSQDEDHETREEMELILMKNRDGKKGIRVVMRWEFEKMDIGEKGYEERFAVRKDKRQPMTHKQRIQQRRRLELERNLNGDPNPWRQKAKPSKRSRRLATAQNRTHR